MLRHAPEQRPGNMWRSMRVWHKIPIGILRIRTDLEFRREASAILKHGAHELLAGLVGTGMHTRQTYRAILGLSRKWFTDTYYCVIHAWRTLARYIGIAIVSMPFHRADPLRARIEQSVDALRRAVMAGDAKLGAVDFGGDGVEVEGAA